MKPLFNDLSKIPAEAVVKGMVCGLGFHYNEGKK